MIESERWNTVFELYINSNKPVHDRVLAIAANCLAVCQTRNEARQLMAEKLEWCLKPNTIGLKDLPREIIDTVFDLVEWSDLAEIYLVKSEEYTKYIQTKENA